LSAGFSITENEEEDEDDLNAHWRRTNRWTAHQFCATFWRNRGLWLWADATDLISGNNHTPIRMNGTKGPRKPRSRQYPCAVPGCGRITRHPWLMCGPHWQLVPNAIRSAIVDAEDKQARRVEVNRAIEIIKSKEGQAAASGPARSAA
jgi:hypothetical protein